MKKALISILLLFVLSPLYSQMKRGEGFALFNMGPYFFNEGFFGEDVDGFGIGFNIEGMASDRFSFGISMNYAASNGDYSDAMGTSRSSDYKLFPSYLMFRYFFNHNKFQPYVAAALGGYFGDVESSQLMGNFSEAGFIAGAPIGFFWFFERFFAFNLFYQPMFVGGDLYGSNFGQTVNVGLLVKFGDVESRLP